MPLLWRYLIKNYLKFFLLTIAAFIAILLISRLQEIAEFISFGTSLKLVFIFTSFQIPYILPIAIPVSCLIASFWLINQLGKNQEILALRSSGYSLKAIFCPLIFLGIFFSLLNFYIVSEIATLNHLKIDYLKNELKAFNPFILLQNKRFNLKYGIYYKALGLVEPGKKAESILIALSDSKDKNLQLLIAKQGNLKDYNFNLDQVTLFSPKTVLGENFDKIFLENIDQTDNFLENFSPLIQQKVFYLRLDTLNMPLLLIHLQQLKDSIPKDLFKIRFLYAEILRRISLGLAPFTFIILGISFGLTRIRTTKSPIIFTIFLASFYLICFFNAKVLIHSSYFFPTIILYCLPHFLIILICQIRLLNLSKGK